MDPIRQHIGEVAHKLTLLVHSTIHLVFQVTCLKKVVESNYKLQTIIQELHEEGYICL